MTMKPDEVAAFLELKKKVDERVETIGGQLMKAVATIKGDLSGPYGVDVDVDRQVVDFAYTIYWAYSGYENFRETFPTTLLSATDEEITAYINERKKSIEDKEANRKAHEKEILEKTEKEAYLKLKEKYENEKDPKNQTQTWRAKVLVKAKNTQIEPIGQKQN
jgi:hypothetical protein